MVDPIPAVIALLKADGAVAAATGGRVFGAELPRGEVTSMPRAAVVVNAAGGGLLGGGYQEYGDIRVDVDCYGTTRATSADVYGAVYDALKHLRREVHATVLLHWARPSAKAVSAVDPDTGWPVTTSSWQLLASEVAAA